MSATDDRPRSVLTIAGSDSGGGAGIQADLKTFAAHGVHGTSAIAALTAQDTTGVAAVHVPDIGFLRAQIDACFGDFRIAAVKLGMLANANVINAVVDALEHYRPDHIVLDPVMVASSGARLLDPAALEVLSQRLMPLASLVTPNLPEAELLLGHPIEDGEAMRVACTQLLAKGARTLMLKGGHLAGQGDLVDLFADSRGIHEITHPRLPMKGHGTGCTLASAIAASLCLGQSPRQACEEAANYVHAALKLGYRPGRGDVVVLDHFGASPR